MFKLATVYFYASLQTFLKAARTLLNGLIRYLAHFGHNFSTVADDHI